MLAALFLVPALSLGGIPPLSGFWAKFMVIDAAIEAKAWWLTGTALLVGLLTLYSMTKIWMEAFWKTPVLPREDARPVPRPMLVAIALLSGLTVVMGLFAQPFVLYANETAAGLVDPSAYIDAVLGPARGGTP